MIIQIIDTCAYAYRIMYLCSPEPQVQAGAVREARRRALGVIRYTYMLHI